MDKNSSVIQLPQRFSALAVDKIAAELKAFKGGNKETAVSKFVASTLTKFCEENEHFAEIVYKTPRTLSDCCTDVMKGCGTSISDIDVYRGAVKHYFPNADVFFKMEIHITGDAPTVEDIQRKPDTTVVESNNVKVTAPKPETTPVKKVASAQKPVSAQKAKPTPKKTPSPKPEVIQLSLL
ncbi:hypothetical protein [Anaerospora hongkongensis]|uniref:hypothetical protein n=1 Tax=Anaerospora hongkongensis TaxID=244830 RepID=UPI002FD9C75E